MAARIKVSNISKHVDEEILGRLFGFIGSIGAIEVRQSEINPEVQEALIEFGDARCVAPALFLAGTELADRTLVVVEEGSGARAAMAAAAAAPAHMVPALAPVPRSGAANAAPLANAAVVAQMAGRGRGAQAIPAHIAALIHPSILQFDPAKAEEISRTVYVGNIAARVAERELMDFFSACGPVAYVKMAGDGLQPTRFAFVEFADLADAQAALQMNGMRLADRPLKVNHSKNAINKPAAAPASASLPLAAQQPPQPLLARAFLGHHRAVPTLAAMASLPSSMDPVAAAAAAAAAMGQQHRSGLAWPVLGDTAAAAASRMDVDPKSAAPRAPSLERRLREVQAAIEEKYAARRPPPASRSRSARRSRVRSPSPYSSRDSSRHRSRRRSRADRDDDDRYRRHSSSRHHRRDDDRYARRHRSRSSERHRHHHRRR
ncbi:hypothetical protein IWQ56_001200 [Coemansia nantahalensis]|nr:hypothetical protein IWQ56_001200 [Coemansia nantahalensis]